MVYFIDFVPFSVKIYQYIIRHCPCFGEDGGGLIDFVVFCRYKKGWGLDIVANRLYLTWKEQMVICSTAWKLITNPSP